MIIPADAVRRSIHDATGTRKMNLREFGQRFEARFGHQPRIFRAPGRVNLIGEHTDYNDGFVMPAAIDFYTFVVASPRNDRKLMVRSENLNQQMEFDLDQPLPRALNDWTDYVRGVAVIFDRAGHHIRGASL